MKLVVTYTQGHDVSSDLKNSAHRLSDEGVIAADFSVVGATPAPDAKRGIQMGFQAVLDFVLQNPDLVLGLFGHITTLAADVFGKREVKVTVETDERMVTYEGPTDGIETFLEEVNQADSLTDDTTITLDLPTDEEA